MSSAQEFETLLADFVALNRKYETLLADFVALENRVVAVERANHKMRGAPSIVEHLKHVYEVLPKVLDVTTFASTEKELRFDDDLRKTGARLGEARRELRGVLISLGASPEELK